MNDYECTLSDDFFLVFATLRHGRIAMFAFVGYIVHANGITWPWAMQLDGTPFPQVSSAPEAWDSISDAAKWQIILFVGFLEYFREANSGTHYMRGGKPGYFPPLSEASFIPGSSLDYYDPFGWSKSKTEEQKADGLVKEINNGRLAMIGILGFLSEGTTPGSVPALSGIIPSYSGEPMVRKDGQIVIKSYILHISPFLSSFSTGQAPFSESIFPSL